MTDEEVYQIALTFLDGIGPQRARLLVSYCGGVAPLFEASERELRLVPGLGGRIVPNLNRNQALDRAKKEAEFVASNGLELFFYLDERYPHRLKHCADAPVLMYGRGSMDLNKRFVVSVVGTRTCTNYGERMTRKLLEGLVPYDPLIVSGLAYGVDTLAHQHAVRLGLQTVGVMGNSLDRVYPFANRGLVDQMLPNGGVLSEFECGTKPDRENFPQRNRIVAGMADVTVVIETSVKGGSMITARLASGYNRDVAAFPGSSDAPYSSGCNHLIKTYQAALIEGVDDLVYLMGWEKESAPKPSQKQLFVELDELESKVLDQLKRKEKESLDNLSVACGLPVSKTATTLLALEFKGAVHALPGKVYQVA